MTHSWCEWDCSNTIGQTLSQAFCHSLHVCLVVLPHFDAIHLSARAMKDSQMEYRRPDISMGGIPGISEFEIRYASEDLIRETVKKVSEY